MHSPYTQDPLDALMAAQASVGATLTALLWHKPIRPAVASVLMLGAAWIAVFSPIDATLLTGMGVHLEPTHFRTTMHVLLGMAFAASVLSRRISLITVAAFGAAALWWLTDKLLESDPELAAAHLAYVGLLVGVHYRAAPPVVRPVLPSPPRRQFALDDLVIFAVATTLAALVAVVVLDRYTNSGDEWAPTYQAALFAHLRPYGKVPVCAEAFRTFWVFQWDGRVFEQYTPGWAYFMTPFLLVRSAWLAGPFSLGLAAVGVARLTRRAAAGFKEIPPRAGEVRAAGWIAGAGMTLGSTMLINGASRYSHVFVAAMFAWSMEALFVIAEPTLERGAQWIWGSLLGLFLSVLLATRPADGATLGIGLFLYFAYAMARGRFGWQSIAATALAFTAVSALTLFIMKLQVGKWFTTGYSLNKIINPWVSFGFGLPELNQYRWAFPIATGSYCWWPVSPALGFAGLAALRGRASRISFISFFSFVPYLAFYMMMEMGRGGELGYGPRYQFPCVVPMAIGTGVMLGKLFGGVHAPLRARGPASLAIAAALFGVIRIAPLVYPFNYADVHTHNRLHDAIAKSGVHNAIVFGLGGLNNTDPLDLPENLPLEFYPGQDVLIALDRNPELVRCVRENFPYRNFYKAIGGNDPKIVPY